MLATAGFLTIVILLGAILSQRISALTALIAVPTMAALAIGSGVSTATYVVHGIQGVAPVAGMFIFAILYFGVVTDAGMPLEAALKHYADWTDEEIKLMQDAEAAKPATPGDLMKNLQGLGSAAALGAVRPDHAQAVAAKMLGVAAPARTRDSGTPGAPQPAKTAPSRTNAQGGGRA